MAGAIVEIANAKINLSLRVLGKGDDGYHQLESLVVFARIADTVTCEDADELSLDITGPFAAGLTSEEDNLVLQAGRVFSAALGRDPTIAFTLEKNLPVASGIGGGSADAAAAMRACMRLWDDPPGSIDGLALQLGADVPVCLQKHPSFMTGIGENIRRVPRLPEMHAVLVNPGIAISTADVFKRLNAGPVCEPQRLPVLGGVETMDRLVGWLETNGNDLEAPAIELAPVIGEVLQQLRESSGCRVARMSGSGATCFALYENPFDAAEAAAVLAKAQPAWWVQATRFLNK
jgi:4-diphosphocytidyl-2-C-methyl-D-erythritol kinase